MKRTVVTMVLGGALLGILASAQAERYEPNWESLDKRPNPEWYRNAKFGIFIHWGVYAVPSWSPKNRYSEWYWQHLQDPKGETWQFHVEKYGEDFKYQDFVNDFTAQLFDPDQWADIFARAGAKYVVLTSKHHEGFCLWPSKESWNWNSVDCMPHRDLCGELTTAVRARGLKMGFYYSLYEWFNPLYHSDPDRYVEEHMIPQMKDLVTRYSPSLVWPDGEWDYPSEKWKSEEFLAWLFNESPCKDDVAVNDRWGGEARHRHGGFYTTEYDPGSAEELFRGGYDWEECQGIGASFGYNRNEDIDDYKNAKQVIDILIDVVSHGGNLLLDIGPTADGRIPVIMQERLLEIGQWLERNGEAIYGTRPWRFASEGDTIRYTSKGDTIYAISKVWPGKSLTLQRALAKPGSSIHMLGYDKPLKWTVGSEGLTIEMPQGVDPSALASPAYAFRLEVLPAVDKVTIEPNTGIMTDASPVQVVTMSTATKGAVIRYTLDGSEPTSQSSRYSKPLDIRKDADVRAKAFKSGMLDSLVSSAEFRAALKPLDVSQLAKGIRYRYYEDNTESWKKVPDFSMLKPVDEGVIDRITIDKRKRDENIAFQFTGYIQIPRDGLYTFYTDSDDGSNLFINGRHAIDNDGPHSQQEKSVQLPLRAGFYELEAAYQQGSGTFALIVSYEGPGIEKQPIPANVLFHKP